MGFVFISSEMNAIMSVVTQAPRRTALVVGFLCGVALGTTGALPTSLAARAGAHASFQISPAPGPWHMPSPRSGIPAPF